MIRIADHGVRYECACGGRMLGISPLEQVLEDGLGARLWVASRDGAPGGQCPFCGQPMQQIPAEAAGPPGMAACHTCEQMWLPPPANAWLEAHGGRGASTGAAASGLAVGHPHRCDGCGAPWQPDPDGRCRYCRAQLSAPPPVVVALSTGRQPVDRLVDRIADLLEG